MSQKRFLRDYRATIPANGIYRITPTGNFIMVKQGEELELGIDGNTMTAESGDYAHLDYTYKEIVIRNKTDYEQNVVLACGFGQFHRQQMKGTVTAVAGIVGADGKTYTDDRITESINLAITDTGGFTWTKNQILSEGVHGEDVTYGGGYYDPVKKRIIAFYKNSSSDYRLAEFDPDTFAKLTATGNLRTTSASYFSVDPYRQYASSGTTAFDNKVLIGAVGALESDMTLLELVNDTGIDATNIGAFYDAREDLTYLVGYNLTPAPDAYLFCTINRAGDVTDLQLLDNQAGLAGSPKGLMRTTADGDEFQLSTTGGHAVVNFKTKTITTGTPYAFLGWGALYDWNQNFYIEWPKIGGSTSARKRALEEKDYLGKGYVSVGECAPLQIFNRGSIVKISADVTLTQQGDATVKIEGEVIKAIIELYAAKFGAAVPLDYLDYIYGIKGEGLNTYTGDESFARVGVVDNFTVTSPSKIQLYFSKRLLA